MHHMMSIFMPRNEKNEKKIAKYKSIVCSNFALIIGYLCETKYLNIAIIILLEQGGLIIHREKEIEMNKREYSIIEKWQFI